MLNSLFNIRRKCNTKMALNYYALKKIFPVDDRAKPLLLRTIK
jgi:hypothetical protein